MNADDTRLLRIAYDEAKAGFDEGDIFDLFWYLSCKVM